MSGRVADLVARRIAGGFAEWHGEFRGMTRRARGRFARREWRGAQADAAARLASYQQWVDRFVAEIGVLPPDPRSHWSRVREAFTREVDGWADADVACTFFNSVTRRLLGTVGSDPHAEFTAAHERPRVATGAPPFRSWEMPTPDAGTIAMILEAAGIGARWDDLAGDSVRVASALDAQLAVHGWEGAPMAAEVLEGVFYRNKGAYIVGRLRSARGAVPLVVALTHEARGVAADAVLTSADEASAVFGFSRSYFHADLDQPAPVIAFLHSIMPHKREDELWTAIGYHKHGKTVFYRTLVEHLARPGARFEVSEGDRGMVMAVFTLPSLNVVFKVIKDRFDQPKTVTREEVEARYNLVFAHDRVGRLADAQEFDHVRIARAHFAPDLLGELQAVARQVVTVQGSDVIIRHCYVERRVTPLNLFLRSASPGAAGPVIVDYGNAVRDLAAANIFPGDMLLKNFGVTRHGRVIFYDYDELCLLTDCRFRWLPRAGHEEDELGAEPWFAVLEGDVFPEEFRHFVVLPGLLGDAFMLHHADLFDPRFWLAMQARQRAGEVLDFFPYPPQRRLRAAETSPPAGPYTGC